MDLGGKSGNPRMIPVEGSFSVQQNRYVSTGTGQIDDECHFLVSRGNGIYKGISIMDFLFSSSQQQLILAYNGKPFHFLPYVVRDCKL